MSESPEKRQKQCIQVVDFHKNFKRQDFDSFFMQRQLTQQSDFFVLGIIGAQSTGKSTLLNLLFKTDFNELDRRTGRGQTTQGIWMSLTEVITQGNQNIILFDLEGSDSKERLQYQSAQKLDSESFEKMSSLFALAVSDVLMVNMWVTDVGRRAGSSFSLLKSIFEVKLRLFLGDRMKKILFVLRDFDPEEENWNAIIRTLNQDMQYIWETIHKPSSYEGRLIGEVFQFEFTSLPPMKHMKSEFEQQIEKFRQRFSNNKENGLFDRQSANDINIQDYGLYLQKIWEKISVDEDLNIPDQKVLLGNLRCMEIRNKALQEFFNLSQEVKRLSQSQIVENFKDLCQQILEKVVFNYNEGTIRYDQEAKDKQRQELLNQIDQEFYPMFTSQIKFLNKNCIRQFNKSVEEICQNQNVSDQFLESLKQCELQAKS